MIMPKKSGVIMHFFALFRIYFRINHYIATAKTQLNITAMKKFLIYFCYAAILCSICSCTKEAIELNQPVVNNYGTRAIPTLWFDWENADYMPTPPGQALIPSPWVGAGSIASYYGMDVINDRRAADGWVLVYSTFDPNANGSLVNPYFVLYNEYRGILRIFLYTTTQFVTQSSYVQDALSIISTHPTTMFRFLGNNTVDLDKTVNSTYEQIQPTPFDGSLPLAANKWYMMQYELAYDPTIKDIPYNQIQLNWRLNYYNITQIKFDGSLVGQLKGTIGSSTPNSFAALNKVEEVSIAGFLSLISQSTLINSAINLSTGENNLGLNKYVFKSLYNGIQSAVSSSMQNLPNALGSFLSGIFGGGSNAQPINLSLQANLSLTGSETGAGSFPSSPISMWMPGTEIPSNAVGLIPFYNKQLGVINFSETPNITIDEECYLTTEYDQDGHPYTQTLSYIYAPSTYDYSSYIQINPDVLDIANVDIVKQDIINIKRWYSDNSIASVDVNESPLVMISDGSADGEYYTEWYVRFCIKVTPKNGAPESMIVKTLKLNVTWNTEIIY